MKRRSFIATVAALLSIQVAAKAEGKPVPKCSLCGQEYEHVDSDGYVTGSHFCPKLACGIREIPKELVRPSGNVEDRLFNYFADKNPNSHCAKKRRDPSYLPIS